MPLREGLAGRTRLSTTLWHVEADAEWERHDHVDHEIVVVLGGTFTLDCGGHRWVVPPTLGVWIPAGTVHRAEAAVGTRFYCLYSRPSTCPITWPATTVFAVSPMLTATIGHLDQVALSPVHRRRVETVFFDLLEPARGACIDLPMPRDERARRVAVELIREPSSNRTLDEWGHHVGASTRTLTRMFAAETGMNFDQWRLQARMRIAVHHLVAGTSVAATARKVGYRSTSSFVATFHRAVGTTPGEYASRQRPRHEPGALLTG